MLIDWFTVGAQVLNFVILVWLMKRFLYKPILDAIDKREKGIAASLAAAEIKMAEARHERDEFQRRNDDLDQQRQALLGQAAKDADAARQRLLDEARQAAKALADKRQDALLSEAQRLKQDLVQRTQDEVFAIARKTLADLACTSLEARAAEVFADRLRSMDGADKEGLAKALASASGPALVRSAFDLPGEQRAAIQSAVNGTFSADVPLRFETAPELVGGIELSANGQKVAWSIADYLTSMRRAVGESLAPPSTPDTETAPW
jgi:F-type H+-transporting ATPase subunit b